ncbi:hypothetical protein N9164_06705 [Draconibacterium sp.]|nr:hypothetical protein [Draconibacterium sp.]
MKNYLNKIFALLVAFSLMQSCETDDKTIDDVFNNIERGAVLRTIETPSPTFDFYNTSSEWIVALEAQDMEDGNLLSEINIFSAFVNDGSIGNEVLVKTVSASDFTEGPFGLPRGEISVILQEVLDAGGLADGDYDSGDSFNIRLESVLKDGRTFTSTNAAGTITGGSFYSSPFLYSVQFFCALEDASVFNGNYIVTADAFEDYAPGDIVPVEFVSEYTFRILSTNNAWIENNLTSYMEVTINPADGSAVVSSNECFETNWGGGCLDVTGAGSVGTCTGDINLIIDYGGYTDYAFSLVKQ